MIYEELFKAIMYEEVPEEILVQLGFEKCPICGDWKNRPNTLNEYCDGCYKNMRREHGDD